MDLSCHSCAGMAKQKEGIVELGCPLYAVASHGESKVVLAGGGGGAAKTGVKNLLVRASTAVLT